MPKVSERERIAAEDFGWGSGAGEGGGWEFGRVGIEGVVGAENHQGRGSSAVGAVLVRGLVLLTLLLALPAIAQDTFWRDAQGRPAPDTESRKSVDGVGGWLVVTSDDNWQAKWETPAATVPQFTDAHTVAVGGRLHVLAFIAAPGRNADGEAQVTCDISMQKPDGSFSLQKHDVDCLSGPLQGASRTIYLSKIVMGFVGEKSDPLGQWIVRVTFKDSIKHAVIPLESRFELR